MSISLNKLVSSFSPQPSRLETYCRHLTNGRVVGRAGGCQNCRAHISVTAWRIFSVPNSVELSRPVVMHCYGHLPICPIWACQISQKLVKFATNWADTLWNAYLWNCWIDLPTVKAHGPVVVQRHINLPVCLIWAYAWATNLLNQAALGTS